MRILMTVFICIFLVRCNITGENVAGLYVSRNNTNTVDTLEIRTDGYYINLMYRKSDNSLIYKNVGKWKVENGSITFFNFFSDEDEVHNKEFTKYQEVLITTTLPIETKGGKIIFHHKAMYDDIYLEKIK